MLIEFQSAVDCLTALRVRTYADMLYRGLWDGRRLGPTAAGGALQQCLAVDGGGEWIIDCASGDELMARLGSKA